MTSLEAHLYEQLFKTKKKSFKEQADIFNKCPLNDSKTTFMWKPHPFLWTCVYGVIHPTKTP